MDITNLHSIKFPIAGGEIELIITQDTELLEIANMLTKAKMVVSRYANRLDSYWANYGVVDYLESWDGSASIRKSKGIVTGDYVIICGKGDGSSNFHIILAEVMNDSGDLYTKTKHYIKLPMSTI